MCVHIELDNICGKKKKEELSNIFDGVFLLTMASARMQRCNENLDKHQIVCPSENSTIHFKSN